MAVGEDERNPRHFGEPSHFVAQNGLAELGCPAAERGTGIQSGLCDSLHAIQHDADGLA